MPDEPMLSAAHYRRSYEKTSVLRAHRNEVIDFVFNNVGSETGPHPFHLHGHQMWYLGVGVEAGLWNETRDVAKLNVENPPLCDVFEIPHNGWAVVRVAVDNAGAWIFHCHISSHHMAGMGFVLMVDPDTAPPPPRGFPTHCSSFPSKYLWPNIV
jgi:FtsP/CotA-like multicopper oxidase with cupredoxin domain